MAQQRRGGFKRRKKVDYIAVRGLDAIDCPTSELVSTVISPFSTKEGPKERRLTTPSLTN